MTRSNLSKPNEIKNVAKILFDKNLGVYTYIDENGNVTQIKKEKKDRKKYYPNAETNVEGILGDVYVIGVSDTVAMGVGDDTMAYARYI